MSAQDSTGSSMAPGAEERRYLKWYNKVGYGSGDVAGNVVYVLLSAFVMIYLTDTAGLNPGVIGTLMMLSRLFDGFSDVAFGTLMDRTRTRMGKARPWMFWGFFGCAAMIIAVFAIPSALGDTAKYAWFFIAYTLLNAVFYTANNIAYSALTALVTRNSAERVQMGSIRFIFAFSTSLLIQSVTVEAVDAFGGGAQGWRAVAIIYALLGLAVNSLSVMSVKELPPEELEGTGADEGSDAAEAEGDGAEEKLGLRESLRFLAGNKYYLIILAVFLLAQVFTAMLNMGSVPLMLILSGVASLGMSPLQGTLNALIAEASENTWLRTGKRIDGLMFSCTSLGVKVGGGLGTAVAGWLLAFSGYDGDAAVQADSVIQMLFFMYAWLPLAANALILFLLTRLDVEKANARLKADAGEDAPKE